jgi:protein TonB
MLKRLAFLVKLSSFETALFLSILLHGAVIGGFSIYTFGPPKQIHNRGLDVILVNSRSAQSPKAKDVQALAQANLDGGGNTDQDRRVSTPVPPMSQNRPGEQLEQQQMQRRLQELEARQQALLAKNNSIKLAQEKKDLLETPPSPVSGLDLSESARAMARMEAEISRDIEEYNKRPRRKFIGVRTQEYVYAQYIEDWRSKVERVGTLNYPSAARGRLYGMLTLTVIIDRSGNVVDVEIDRSSGHKVLDEAALRIVHLAAPYSVFPAAIPHDIDQVVITRTWTFTRDNSLETR